jgi:hypothetical protein
MALSLEPTNPKFLLEIIQKEINNNSIETWKYDPHSGFTHTTNDSQWEGRAFLKPHINGKRLIFGIQLPKAEEMQSIVYGVYHGRFAEMLLSHYHNYFTDLEITSRFVAGFDEWI